VQACPGKFEQAQDGTLLLDEITEMDLALQAKLLRVLQEREVERLGGRKTISLNVRVIATSNRDLKLAVDEGKFREDLYYRLNVFPITWQPLAQRIGDIIPLAKHLIQRHAASQGIAAPEISMSAQHKLMQHTWPGNVRELENVIQRALILSDDGNIGSDDLMIEAAHNVERSTTIPSASFLSGVSGAQVDDAKTSEENLDNVDKNLLGSELRFQEHQIILDALQAFNGKRKDVAEKLGISPRTLRYKLARMRDSGIEVPN
jgi:two-component system response regulator FlrC